MFLSYLRKKKEHKKMDEYEHAQQSVWNFDGAELFLIFEIKAKIVIALEEWNFTEAYKKIRLLRMELDAKLARSPKKIIQEFEKSIGKGKSKTEKVQVDEMIKQLDNSYSTFIALTDPDDEAKSKFYKELEKVYMFLCYIMKKHGLYFREGEDSRLAVLRR